MTMMPMIGPSSSLLVGRSSLTTAFASAAASAARRSAYCRVRHFPQRQRQRCLLFAGFGSVDASASAAPPTSSSSSSSITSSSHRQQQHLPGGGVTAAAPCAPLSLSRQRLHLRRDDRRPTIERCRRRRHKSSSSSAPIDEEEAAGRQHRPTFEKDAAADGTTTTTVDNIGEEQQCPPPPATPTPTPPTSSMQTQTQLQEEVVNFPELDRDTGKVSDTRPVLLNSREHAVGYLSKILNARVYEAAIETELQYATNLSAHLGNNVYLKREDTQPVFSFKIRGAYNKMSHLTQTELDCGVVACSAGNHAQGVAKSANMLGCRAVIVMPLATPSIKVHSVRNHGGPTVEVRLFGNNYDEAAAEALRLVDQEGMTLIHPFDDPYVIAGQGTVGVEILKECVSEPLDYIFVCCGGGGMLAGVAAYVKRVRPSVKVIGVESSDAAGMTTSIAEGRVVTLDSVGLFADGAAVRRVGDETFRVCNRLVDEMVTVDTDQICNGIKLSYNDARVILEPAGALAVAGMKKYVHDNDITGKTMVAITSGANMDFDRLRFVSERADESERTIVVTIPETPGSFRALYSLIWPRNVTEFSYRYESSEKANIFLSFQPVLNVEDDFEGVVQRLRENDFVCYDISHNELGKTHVRHMAGGRSIVPHERLFRFEFPEAPGALQRFLLSLDIHWNISLFHYRNHGDDFGRVLVGIQVPEKCDQNLREFLSGLGYRYKEETSNPVYRTFLRTSNGNGSNSDNDGDEKEH